jgi:hypothetical protein
MEKIKTKVETDSDSVSSDDRTWTTEEETFLSKLEKQCNDLYTHSITEYRYYQGMSSKFNIPILIISAINALCAISLSDFLAQKYVSILNAVLSAGAGVLGSIQLYMKLNEKMTNALRASVHLKKLALRISKELTIARKDRQTQGQQFLADVFAEFNTVIEQSNPIESEGMKNHLEFSIRQVEKESGSPLARFAKLGKFVLASRTNLPALTPRKESLDESLRSRGIGLASYGGDSPV